MADSSFNIVILSGSMRKESFNRSLVRYVGSYMAEVGNVKINEVNLGEINLPMFSEDDVTANGVPSNVIDFKRVLMDADAVLVSSPEYNGSLTGALKNAIDWASSPGEGEKPLACFRGKVCGLLSASPGAIGGLVGLSHLRQILTRLQMIVVPTEYALGVAHEAFDDNGRLTNEKAATMAKGVGLAVLEMTKAIKNAG